MPPFLQYVEATFLVDALAMLAGMLANSLYAGNKWDRGIYNPLIALATRFSVNELWLSKYWTS